MSTPPRTTASSPLTCASCCAAPCATLCKVLSLSIRINMLLTIMLPQSNAASCDLEASAREKIIKTDLSSATPISRLRSPSITTLRSCLFPDRCWRLPSSSVAQAHLPRHHSPRVASARSTVIWPSTKPLRLTRTSEESPSTLTNCTWRASIRPR